AALGQVLGKMLARDPARRYQTAAAVAAAVEPFYAAAGSAPAKREPPAAPKKEGVPQAAGAGAGFRDTPLPPQRKRAEAVRAAPSEQAKAPPQRPVIRRNGRDTRRNSAWAVTLLLVGVGGLGVAGLWFAWAQIQRQHESEDSGQVVQSGPQAR